LLALKKLRTEKNMTMKQVSTQAGIAESTYSLIESGNRRPSPEVAQKLGKILGFDWTAFYTENPKETEDGSDGGEETGGD